MKITIISVGKIKEKFYREAVAEYAKRLSSYCKFQIIELADEKTPENASFELENQIKDKEGERILKSVDEKGYLIALAIEGKKFDSVQFSNRLEKLMINGNSHIQFVIGGSLGLSENVLKKADDKISFSDMTFPHQLMRVILSEQIYRAFRIMNHEPYHK
ncbi:MAG: 23S rRNA (pseudouridine(1915)-N(3))-methyltransferase RlmH [Lachnospiraceae bacterium]|nr:23S rRNA (pseudouridine(1915)-N(3))-methyltransferase RlmH [Lachnospiraceae bacterium]